MLQKKEKSVSGCLGLAIERLKFYAIFLCLV